MNDEINYKNHPLQGVGLEQLVTEIVDHYGFEILFAYLNINCFKTKPSIKSSVKFLKKTDWAREKVEAFYMYQYKNLPRASSEQFEIPPRDRIIPQGQVPGEPAKLSLEDAERLQEKRAKKAAEYRPNKKQGGFDNKRSKPRENGPFQKQAADKQKSVYKQEAAEKSAPEPSDSRPSTAKPLKPRPSNSNPSSSKPSNSSDPWSKWRE